MEKREHDCKTAAECVEWALEILRHHPEANIYIEGEPFYAAYEKREQARDRAA